ncbi:MAG: phosphomannomutase/phosphoglucomutase [Deltaproteobacteria bacterium]|nr:phosphomannomutase/phosphoglucomutase [Deltaproteobacteria bacterium]
MNPRVFREYDIRGVADRDFPDDFVSDLGAAIGRHLYEAGSRRVCLGRDARISSPRISTLIQARLLDAGLDVVDVGILHSPGLYFSVFHLNSDGGVMVTASHNPSEDNGFKIMRGKNAVFGEEIQELRRRIERDRAGEKAPTVPRGKLIHTDILTPYIDYIVNNIKPGKSRLKVVVDAGNGTGGISCVPILQRLGFDVDPLFCDADGRFPNHHPDPTVPENNAALIARVKEIGADLGIALDGDADRVGAVDGNGRIVWGDQLVVLFAREILKRKPGSTFISEVKCSAGLYDEIAKAGGTAIMYRVGHSIMKQKLKDSGAELAGEMSGHIFFADRWFGFDDGVYAAARLCELISNEGLSLSEMVDTLPVFFNTPELRLECPDEIKFEVVTRAVAWYKARHEVNDIDGARVTFPGGWGLIRASNTGPVVVLRCEADSPERLATIRAELEGRLATLRAEVEKERAES